MFKLRDYLKLVPAIATSEPKAYFSSIPIGTWLALHIFVLTNPQKTNNDVRRALLLPLDDGTYLDRRNGKKLNTSKTIWIFATNHSEEIIDSFADKHRALGDDFAKKVPLDVLKKDLRTSFKQSMGAPLIGRITAIVPFFPFTEEEQAVVAHTFLLKEMQKCRMPVNLKEDKLVGDLQISTLDDGKLCALLAKNHYDPELGARSLAHAVNDEVMVPLVEEFLDQDQGLERGPRADVAVEKYVVRIEHDEKTDESEIVLRKEGETRLKSVTHKVEEPLFSSQESWKWLEQGSFTMIDGDANAQAAEMGGQEKELRCTPGSEYVSEVCDSCSGEHSTAACATGMWCYACGHNGHDNEDCPVIDA
jgi:hypothetical protein